MKNLLLCVLFFVACDLAWALEQESGLLSHAVFLSEVTPEQLKSSANVEALTTCVQDFELRIEVKDAGTLSEAEKLMLAKRRLKVNVQYSQFFHQVLACIDQLDQATTDGNKRQLSVLVKACWKANCKVSQGLSFIQSGGRLTLDLEEVFKDEELFELVTQMSLSLDYYKYFSFLTRRIDKAPLASSILRKLKKIEPFIGSPGYCNRLNGAYGLESLERQVRNEFSQLTHKELQEFHLGVVVKNLLDEGYFLDPNHKSNLLREIQEEIKDTEKSLAENVGNRTVHENRLSELKKNLSRLQNQEFLSLGKVFDSLATQLAEMQVQCNFEGTLKSVRSTFLQGYPYKKFVLQEGDIILEVDPNGFGAFFNTVLGIDAIITHTGLVSSGICDGYRYYYLSEMLSTPQQKPVSQVDEDAFLVRPLRKLNAGYTDQANQNLNERKFKFDMAFTDGVYDAKGAVHLYCAEYVHYVFKTQLSSQPSLEGDSPWDPVNTSFEVKEKILGENLRVLGILAGSKIYLPDALLYSTAASFIGVQTKIREPEEEMEEEVEDFCEEQLMEALRTRKFKKLGFFKKLKLDAEIKIVLTVSPEFANVLLPEGDAHYYFFLLFKVEKKTDELTSSLEEVWKGQEVTEEQKREILTKRYEQEVRPFLNDLFE